VIAVGPKARPPTIVVGYDGSESARAALNLALRRARPDGRVFVVHAYDLPPDFLGDPNYDSLLHKRQDQGRELLEALPVVASEGPDGVQYETELIGGPPAQAIESVARARKADEIIIGARGLGRLRALLGSASHELLHIADRPVTVIPSAAVGTTNPATRDPSRRD
jgi:nucleotide-binding universal stress UspA family protein